MKRKAVNSSGCIGTLYDGCRDYVVDKSDKTFQTQRHQSHKPPQCELINGTTNASRNLLRYTGVEDELRLNLLLNLTNRAGIAAIMDYSCQINERTRFIYYSWIRRTEQLAENERSGLENSATWNPLANATHIITGVTIGIDVIVILQLPSETDIINKIDFILSKMRGVLLSDNNIILELTSIEKNLLGKIVNTTVYSNIPSLTALFRILDILPEIDRIKHNAKRCLPVFYTLESIISLSSRRMGRAATFNPLSSELKEKVERYLFQFRDLMKDLDVSRSKNLPKLLRGHLQSRLRGTSIQWPVTKDTYMHEIKRFRKLVVDAHEDRKKVIEIDQALHDEERIVLMNSIDELTQNLADLERKGCLNTDLKPQQFEQEKMAKLSLDKDHNTRTIQRTPISDDRRDRVSYSSGTSNKKKPESLSKPRRDSVEELESNFNSLSYPYDASYYTPESPDTKILPSRTTNNDDASNDSRSLSTIHPDIPVESSSSPPSPTNEIINILLVGETGVGKSTFINAFANYLTFESLEQAQSNEPMVLIPVSFIMTTGNNFDEHTIKFGEFDSANNEDFNAAGQSVTQHCKSYLFDLNHTDGKKLRIIDTPGFGDTRGLDQDERNMEHILQYVNNLTHLNAICFLLKPNATRLSIFFRTCLTQLFSLLGANARENILFCFTNARSTFYTPGNTLSLLKTMLESLSISDIPFKKDNTFCFDNESFRFLVALQNEISFSNDDEREYKMSWSTSVKESNRLIDYIRTKLTAYHFEGGWQSIKHAQFEISHMIRPMLETMRNILRNIILFKMNVTNESIELIPTALHRTATRCLSCKPSPRLEGQFWVVTDLPHEIQNECLVCACSVDQHVPIDYALEYRCWRNTSNHHQHEMNDILDVLCHASAHFAYFLMHTACSTKDDPFLIGLVEMIMEENDLCKSQKPNQFNYQLSKDLTQTQILYEQRMSKLILNHQSTELPVIYKLVRSISEYPMIREQLAAVKRTQKMMMEQYEYEAQKI